MRRTNKPDAKIPDPKAIREAEEAGLVFSEDKKTLLECRNKKIETAVIPDGVTKIETGVFAGCTSLTNVVIPNGVTGIGYSTFFRCTALTGIKIPDSVTRIGLWAFQGCSSFDDINIPDGVTVIGKGAFAGAGCEEQVKRDYPRLFKQTEV